ncbi:MAG: universal stress protein [Verrucomicrobiales bacterium]|nr:universal stress protein [Verrucomicrobiales bacterium]
MLILCETDFSIHASEAASVAALLAARLQGTLLLVHVYNQKGLRVDSRAAFDALHQRWEARLSMEATRCRGLGAIVETRLLPGSASAVLLDVAARRRAGLIVLSSLSNVPPVRWLLGSVAERVSEYARVPTLVVRGGPAFRAWAAGENPLRVVVVSNSNRGTSATLRWAQALNTLHRCTISVSRLALAAPGFWWQCLGEERPPDERAPQPAAGAAWDTLGRGPAGRQAVARATAEAADLIVVGINRPRGFARLWHHPVSRDILREAPMSVVCVPCSGWHLLPMAAFQRLGQPARDSRSAPRRRVQIGAFHDAPPAHRLRRGRRQPQNQEMTRA